MASSQLFRLAAQPAATVAAVGAASRPAYHVARNTRGALPVYSDWKINKTKYVVEIRNVDGDANALKADLKATLFQNEPERARRLAVDVVRGRHLRLSGLAAHYKDDVFRWLLARGF